MKVREVQIRVVSNGTAQWDQFEKCFSDLFEKTPQETISKTETIISPGKTATEITVSTNLSVSIIRDALEASQTETVSVFCPHEHTNPKRVGKRASRRRAGKKRHTPN